MDRDIMELGVLPTLEELEQMQKRIPELVPSAVLSMLEVMQAVEKIQRQISDVLEREYHVSEGKLRLLIVLYQTEGTMKPSALAKRIGVTKATISGLLHRLERDMLISRSVAAEDHRSNEVRLTGEGRSFIERIMPEHYLRISNLMGRLTEEEQETLMRLAQKLVENRG
ncbi:transcriptional regulator YetL [Selenomonas sp. TAMA-11512]|uniref:MarR family winged helix-turn-helix transcriptional regulator n=1 Tax=Selenomonas sp. TAMA-11512 TaxID=3095337 RepID=UPI00308CC006|nr:transcriptional regulator YetL [Selenomonas sp. TAMA-11512]